MAYVAAANFDGPNNHSLHIYIDRFSKDNFIKLAALYGKSFEKTGRVPTVNSKDETAIIAKVTYHQDDDVLRGYCGKEGSNHICEEGFDVACDDNEAGYEEIQGAFADCRKGSCARAILLSPLHPDLLKIAFAFILQPV